MFDGIHRGHKALLEKANKLDEFGEYVKFVYSFINHPSTVLGDGKTFLRLPPSKKNGLIAGGGMDYLALMPFNCSFLSCEPEEFIGR
jgi:riboflavin kinase/FMN adenylyltransferase